MGAGVSYLAAVAEEVAAQHQDIAAEGALAVGDVRDLVVEALPRLRRVREDAAVVRACARAW